MTTTTTSYENYQQYCMYRLPCGICTRTNSMCPLQNQVTWNISSTNISSTQPTTADTFAAGQRGKKNEDNDR